MRKFYVIPEEDVIALMKATEQLIEFLGKSGHNSVGRLYPESFTHITGPMSKINTNCVSAIDYSETKPGDTP